MKQKARKNVRERTWAIQTSDTYMLHARVPHELRDRLKAYIEASGKTITDTVIEALEEHLEKSGH